MPTIADALGSLEEELFVGREAELGTFQQWLRASPTHPIILNVTGPGGVGKTTLLGAFQRIATAQRRAVVTLDGRDLHARPGELERALELQRPSPRGTTSPQRAPLVLVDSFDELGSMARGVVDQLIRRLDTGVKLVIAGRYPLGPAWPGGGGWHGRLSVLALRHLAVTESRAYLSRRGLSEPRLVEQILAATRGHPLALSLAADLVEQLGVTDFGALPEWRLAVRSLVELLLRDVADPLLRELLEAAAVVHQFDEATLEGVSGRSAIGPAFGRLCQLSIVRPSAHGLTLHDDARQILAEDLRWRHKDRYTQLRLRALTYYRERMRTATVEDRAWLLVERFYLWEGAFIQTATFSDVQPGAIWVSPYRPEDRADMLRIWSAVVNGQGGPSRSPFAAELPGDFFERLLDYPGTFLAVARDREGQALAFGVMLPLSRDSICLLPPDGPLLRLARAYLGSAGLAALPQTAETSTLLCAFRMAALPVDDPAPPAAQALLREAGLGLLGRGLTYLVATPDPFYQQFVLNLGFDRVPAATCDGPDPQHPAEGFVLDLARIGVEPWIEALMAGRKPPRVLPLAELEHAVQDALLHWRDDVWLAGSDLAQSAAVARIAPDHSGAQAVRAAVARALEQARAGAPTEQALALHALETAYLTRTGSHEQAAEELAVSRRTFYRLLQRGVQALAQALDRPPS